MRIPTLDLHLDLGLRSGRRVGLERALRDAIRSGRLASGTAVPSSRDLAAQLGIARSTVVSAYEQLAAEGFLIARQGAATIVAAGSSAHPTPAELFQAAPMLDHSWLPGEGDPHAFPRQDWARATRRAIEQSTAAHLGYGDPAGISELRVALARYLGRSRAVLATSSRIAVFGGTHAAMGFLAETFAALGIDTIATENPTLPFLRPALGASGLHVVPVPVDQSGLVVEALSQTGARAVLVTPAHQYPMGVPMSPERRAELVGWARANDAWIIEDDYDGEFRFDRQAIGAMQALDPERVIYAGTASKSLAAGLRLAWLALPAALVGPLTKISSWRRGVSNLEQLALAEFIDSGDLDRHLRLMRRSYRARREQLVATLQHRAPYLEPTGVAAGLHVTMLLRAGAPSEEDLLIRAAANGLQLFSLGFHRFGPDRTGPPGLVLGYSRQPSHAFDRSLEHLANTLAGIQR
jgi:GntR family transcriptional regulator / MocR family aminotransferase